MAKYTKKKCPIVRVYFTDHCQATGGEAELAKCQVFGVLIKETPEAYYVASWVADGVVDNNTDSYAILKHKGIKLERLGWF